MSSVRKRPAIVSVWRAVMGDKSPVVQLGCERCPKSSATGDGYCECNRFIDREVTPDVAVRLLAGCASRGMACVACGDTPFGSLVGCDTPHGCGQWQEWRRAAFGECPECNGPLLPGGECPTRDDH